MTTLQSAAVLLLLATSCLAAPVPSQDTTSTSYIAGLFVGSQMAVSSQLACSLLGISRVCAFVVCRHSIKGIFMFVPI